MDVAATVTALNKAMKGGMVLRQNLHQRLLELMFFTGRNEINGELTPTWDTPIAKFYLPKLLDITNDFWIEECNLLAPKHDDYGYSSPVEAFTIPQFDKHRTTIEEMWRGPVIIERHPAVPAGVRIRPTPKIPAMVPLTGVQVNTVIFGTDLLTGELVRLRVDQLPHMLIVGTSGFGKSVFLNQIITQLLVADPDQVAELMLVDLKGGIEFHGYARKSNRVRVVWEFDEVVETVEALVELMLARQREMVSKSWRLYPGRRVFFVVDEFAQIQLYPAETKEEKATHARLIANLNRLSMLGRAVGVVLVVAIQKPTTDVMDSSFRMNLQGQICFKVPNRLLASTMFGSVEDLRFDPVTLRKGQFIFYDPTSGTTRYLQSHVAPE